MKRTRSTRSKTTAESSGAEAVEGSTTAASLLPSVDNPPKAFILPKNASPDARIVTLSNPATSTPNRYYLCPEKGFYEFTKIAVPSRTPKSWLFAPNHTSGQRENEASTEKEQTHSEESTKSSDSLSRGYVTKSADIFVATPFDPLFLLLPALLPVKSKDNQKKLFLSADDHLDSLGESSIHLKHSLRDARIRKLLEKRFSAVCDTVDAGDESMYRLSQDKLLDELLSKAKRTAANKLPASMDEHFVRKALEAPIMGVKREVVSAEITTASAPDGTPTTETPDTQSQSEDMDSQSTSNSNSTQSTTATSVTLISEISAAVEAAPENTVSQEILELMRIRTALNFICTSYLAPHVRKELQSMLSAQRTIDFRELDEHLEHIASLKAEAQALRSISDNISRKRGMEDDEAAEIRAEKKRKKEDEEKKKKLQSHGVKQLAKVNTKGMQKLSAFFTKAPKKG